MNNKNNNNEIAVHPDWKFVELSLINKISLKYKFEDIPELILQDYPSLHSCRYNNGEFNFRFKSLLNLFETTYTVSTNSQE